MEEIKETAVLAGIESDRRDCEYSTEATIGELAELAKTAGAQVAARILQPKDAPDAASYLGSGKLEELKQLCENVQANLVIFDDELTGSQQRNIENALNVRVIDRSMLILDIFASRAFSREGKLQVELAQLKYMLPRLGGIGASLSRLGAGIGTRGPGETKLETDRRHIRRRISHIQSQLQEVAQRRGYTRARRKKDGVAAAVLAGYTNAGKSTILNYFTDAGVLSENKLFATLDPTARALTLPDDREILLIDTVGFIRKLPHHLINAFKSTLEELAFADIIINVADYSSTEAAQHIEVSRELIKELAGAQTPVITAYNKCDAVSAVPESKGDTVYVSAKTGENMDALLKTVAAFLPETKKLMHLLLPYDKAGLEGTLREDAFVRSVEYVEEGIKITADVDKKAVYKYERFTT